MIQINEEEERKAKTKHNEKQTPRALEGGLYIKLSVVELVSLISVMSLQVQLHFQFYHKDASISIPQTLPKNM